MKQRDILKFWLPLLGSWILLTAEGPLVTLVVNRLADPIVMLAASGIVISLSVFIESPIINILSTSTAKVRDLRTYRLVRNFTIHWLILLTALHVLMGYTPLFDLVVIRGMGISAEISEWVRVGMRLMILWSAAIGWRRFLQGVLIHFGRTRTITIGTAIRLVVAAATLFGLGMLTDLPGVVVAAITWTVAVSAEAIYSTFAVRPLFANELSGEYESDSNLTYSSLFWFHLPLASTSMLALLLQPLVVFSLARQPESELTLAAWPLLFQILLLARAPALAIPEVIIALNKDAERTTSLRRFVMTVATATLVGMLLFIYTPLSALYLLQLQGVVPDIAAMVLQGLAWSALFPVLTLIAYALRGFLISRQATRPINIGMIINLTTTAVTLMLGVLLGWSGIVTAAIALNAAVVIELVYLFWQERHDTIAPLAVAN